MTAQAWACLSGGAADEWTLRENAAAYQRPDVTAAHADPISAAGIPG